MKRVMIVSTGIADEQGLAELDQSPQFRKATFNMKMSYLAVEEALKPLAAMRETFKTDMALFLGTSHGEFNTTLDFLKSWAQQKLARPFVFQNSLHNSTTGFVGLSEGYRAPLVTSSHHYFSGEDALDLACQFIKTGMAAIATVVGVDARAGDYLPHMKGAGFPHADWGQGAGCVILTSQEYADKHQLPILGELALIEMRPALDRPVFMESPDFDVRHFYDAQAVENLAQSVRQGRSQELRLEKPNGGHSRIAWVAK